MLGSMLVLGGTLALGGTSQSMPVPLTPVALPATDDVEASLARQLDGNCSGIFVDLGANIGMHARFLFEPESYPQSTYQPIFEQHFDAKLGSRGSVCVVAFEPNPAQSGRLSRLSAAYATRGWRVIYAPYGAGAARGTLTFYHNDNDGDAHEEWTFGTHRMHDSDERVDVLSIDFARFLNLVAERDTAVGGTPRPVVIKMDIEGSEFEVLTRMLESGAMCRGVDAITCEFHPWNHPFEGLGLHNRSQAESYAQALRTMTLFNAPSCRAQRIEDLDDESYLHDRNAEQRRRPTAPPE